MPWYGPPLFFFYFVHGHFKEHVCEKFVVFRDDLRAFFALILRRLVRGDLRCLFLFPFSFPLFRGHDFILVITGTTVTVSASFVSAAERRFCTSLNSACNSV